LDKLLEYRRNWIQHVNRIPRNKLPRVMKRYWLTGRMNHGRPLQKLLDMWDRNGSTIGPNSWQIDDDNNYYYFLWLCSPARAMASSFHEVTWSRLIHNI
jgi:hypothetical protein